MDTDFYPHMPIQIYTENRERFLHMSNKTKKLILLGNSMFDDATWSIKSLKTKTNKANSTYPIKEKCFGRQEYLDDFYRQHTILSH
jgi:hypothetical protein